jgi:hypothetical protein
MADNRLVIQSAADITSRERYKAPIDPAANPFKRIVRHYWLRIPIQCAIKSCRQPHNDGFLVELVSGDETNIGHVCGKKYFGMSFAEGVDNYRRDILGPELRQKLLLSKNSIRSILPKVEELCAEEEATLGRQKRNFRRLFPQLCKVLSQRAARGQSTITQARQRPHDEIERLVALNPGTPRDRFVYEEVTVAQIKGLKTFEENLHELLHGQLREPIEEFLLGNVALMTVEQLIKTDTWLRYIDETLSRAESAIADARAFFSEDNIESLRYLELPNDERKILNYTRLQSLAKGDPRDLLNKSGTNKLNRKQRRKMMFGMR